MNINEILRKHGAWILAGAIVMGSLLVHFIYFGGLKGKNQQVMAQLQNTLSQLRRWTVAEQLPLEELVEAAQTYHTRLEEEYRDTLKLVEEKQAFWHRSLPGMSGPISRVDPLQFVNLYSRVTRRLAEALFGSDEESRPPTQDLFWEWKGQVPDPEDIRVAVEEYLMLQELLHVLKGEDEDLGIQSVDHLAIRPKAYTGGRVKGAASTLQDEYFKDFKRIPFQLAVVMDLRKVPRLFARLCGSGLLARVDNFRVQRAVSPLSDEYPACPQVRVYLQATAFKYEPPSGAKAHKGGESPPGRRGVGGM